MLASQSRARHRPYNDHVWVRTAPYHCRGDALRSPCSSLPCRFSTSLLLFLFCSLLLTACAPNQGIFGGGGSWQPTGLQYQHIRTLEVNPQQPQQLYAGSTDKGVFASIDAGTHWTPQNVGLPLPDAINMLAFEPTGKKLYAATAKGLFVSTDAAQHWQPVNSSTAKLPNDSYTALAFDVNNTQVVYVGTAQHGVWMSNDQGGSWSQISTGLPQNLAINNLAFDPTQHQLWAATPSGIYQADSHGTAWQAAMTGLPGAITVYSVVPVAAYGGTQGLVYAGTSNGFYLSTDNGAHWTANPNLLHVHIYSVLVDFRSTNATTVYVGTIVGAFRSNDNGQNWGSIAPGLPKGSSVYAMLIGGNSNSQLYAAADTVYLFPGTTGGFSFSNTLPLLFILLLFFVLYRVTMRNRNKLRKRPDSETSSEKPFTTPML